MSEHDFDWLVVGSGFGGSVAALRLAERGYRVGVLEAGRRVRPEDFPKSAWDLRRYFFAPKLGCRGVMRMTLFKDVFITSGAGVGGGSLIYAMTLYVPHEDAFYEDPQWRELADWRAELAPYYAEAERMLGVTDYVGSGPADGLLRELGERLERHIRFEEPELFPMIEAALPDDELVQLGEAFAGAEAPHG